MVLNKEDDLIRQIIEKSDSAKGVGELEKYKESVFVNGITEMHSVSSHGLLVCEDESVQGFGNEIAGLAQEDSEEKLYSIQKPEECKGLKKVSCG